DRDSLYRCASLIEAGIRVAGSTDAPYGDLDPWRAMTAAVERRTRGGQAIGATEALTRGRALALFLGPYDAPGGLPRRVGVGAPADLCLLRVPMRDALDALDASLVAMTFRAGTPLT